MAARASGAGRRWTAVFGLLVLGGCATSFVRGPLRPVPRSASEVPLYAQVRELGRAQALGFVAPPSPELGVTLDLHNRGTRPVSLDLAGARLVTEPIGPGRRVEARAVASGPGGLPGRTQLGRLQSPSLTLAPGQRLTIWLVFGQLALDDEAPRRFLVRIPALGAPEVVVKLSDPEQSPQWTVPLRRTGVGLMAATHAFAGEAGATFYASPWGLYLWHARGPALFRLTGEGLALYESRPPVIRSGTAWWVSLDATLAPRNWVVGGYAAGHLVLGDYAQTSYGGHPQLFGASLGVIVRGTTSWPAPFALRIGYTRLFGVARANGVTLGFEVPIF
jgi:hypothetical protein